MRVASVNVGRPNLVMRAGRTYRTSINRRSIAERVWVGADGLAGDQVADLSVHGGPQRAVCLYPLENYGPLGQRIGRELAIPAFGENLTTEGLSEQSVAIGDVFRIGTVRFQVSSPRDPCAKLARKHAQSDLPMWIVESGRCGFYLRVMEEGEVGVGDAIELLDRPHPAATVARVQRVRYAREASEAEFDELLAIDALSPSYRAVLERRRSGSPGAGE